MSAHVPDSCPPTLLQAKDLEETSESEGDSLWHRFGSEPGAQAWSSDDDPAQAPFAYQNDRSFARLPAVLKW